jgi:hypothetical protein
MPIKNIQKNNPTQKLNSKMTILLIIGSFFIFHGTGLVPIVQIEIMISPVQIKKILTISSKMQFIMASIILCI